MAERKVYAIVELLEDEETGGFVLRFDGSSDAEYPTEFFDDACFRAIKYFASLGMGQH